MERLKLPMKVHKALINGIRKAFHLSGMHNSALKVGRVGWGKYICGICKEETKRKEVQVDHVEPVCDVTDNKEVGYDYLGFIKRMFDHENLMVVCKSCHHKKSAEENSERRKNKNETIQE